MFNHSRFIAIFIISILISGCSDPRDTAIPSDINTWKSDKELTTSIEKLSEEDKKLFAAYAMRTALSSAFGGSKIEAGTTIGDAIDIQKQWITEQENQKEQQRKLADELKNKQVSALKEMNDALTVTLISFKFNNKNIRANQYSDYFTISVGFKNNTDRNMPGVKGVVVLKDIFGEVIKKVNLSFDENLAANGTATFNGTIDFNQFMDNDKKLRSTSFEKLQFEWVPDIYLFDDGTKLVMPKN